MVTFYFSAKSTAYVVIFWLSMAKSFLSSATVNLWYPSIQEWFLMHAWPTGLLIWACAAGDTGSSKQPWVFRMKKGVDDHFLCSLQFFWAACPELVTQGALLTCVQLTLYAGTLFLEVSRTSAWCSFPWRSVSLLLPFSLYDFSTIKPWTWSNSRIPSHMCTSKSPHRFSFAIQYLGL